MLITIIFALFSFPDYAEKCMEYLSSKHLNIRFSLEKEKGGFFFSFLVSTFFETMGKLQLLFIEKRPSSKNTLFLVDTSFKRFMSETYKNWSN